MFWEPQNSSLHHEGGEFLLPTVAESECTNYKQHIEWQTYRNKIILCVNVTLRQRILPFYFHQYLPFAEANPGDSVSCSNMSNAIFNSLRSSG